MNIKCLSTASIISVLMLGQAGPAFAQLAAPRCEAKSGVKTAALVELYSSEGCSSCPPADQRLSALHREAGADALIVPLALHVTYWDQIGWADRLAQKPFDARQAELLSYQPRHVAYTPQFFVSGSELRGWDTQLPAAIRRINAVTAPVNISVSAAGGPDGKLQLAADASAADGRTGGMLYLALSENALSSTVLRGENQGATLHHDAAVRVWLGPVALQQGHASLHRELSIPAGWRRDHLQVAAFVQQAGGGAILQAVSTAQCEKGVL
ncbi:MULTISPECIES: DUF1223 domain-containing protein [unclassified Janthinobacterium]|jgi:hypothetical protein|uniref:DUF1223 domain-containing protein n=1 Tax=unclassified Janthinobacterium TaxID=2610881 RepID=UPI0016173DC0|nr:MULTISPECIES: DUF1223 domain-containing protein [unclassified Janthinobacterium]MBB5606140.1 hypothetical protein [Janthinobacterium sp. S3T4]MBB5611987.1 hypothetical protein [Janthinobacterium sp. S3M3]